MTLHRVTNLKLKKNGDEYEKVQLRNKWVARVEANTVGMQLAPGDTPEAAVLDWCKNEPRRTRTSNSQSGMESKPNQRPKLLAKNAS